MFLICLTMVHAASTASGAPFTNMVAPAALAHSTLINLRSRLNSWVHTCRIVRDAVLLEHAVHGKDGAAHFEVLDCLSATGEQRQAAPGAQPPPPCPASYQLALLGLQT